MSTKIRGPHTMSFEYPSEIASEGKMFAELTDFLDSVGVTGRLRHSIMLCVSEAFVNGMVHGNRLIPERKVRMCLGLNENRLSADIEDEGQGGLGEIHARRPSELLSENGRGIDLIMQSADAVETSVTPNGGLHIRMEFSLQRSEPAERDSE